MTGRKVVPRRDTALAWESAGWFYLALWCIVLTAFAPPFPVVALLLAAAVPSVVLGVRKYLRLRNTPAVVARRELLATLRALPPADAWLNRDEHAQYHVQVSGLPSLRAVSVIRVDEDDIQAYEEEGSAQVVVQVWRALSWEAPVTCAMRGTTVTEAEIEKGVIEFPGDGFLQYLKGQRAARKAGILHATPDELRTLVAALRGAEPVPPPEDAP